MLKLSTLIILLIITASNGFAGSTIPSEDLKGSRDSSLIGRYKGSYIVAFEHFDFDEFIFPLSALEKTEGKKDSHNNSYFEPKEKMAISGERTRLVYLMPENVSPSEVILNYQTEIKNKGGEILFECSNAACGGDPERASTGGGGKTSMSMFLCPEEHIQDPLQSGGRCAQVTRITAQKYIAGKLDDTSGTHLSILAYTLKTAPSCRAFNGRTVAAVDIVEPKQNEQKMITVKSEEMAQKISSTGSISLYGVFFDFNKADIKPESRPAIDQIAKLLKENPELKLMVVGHTDNTGSFQFNMELSQLRARAVTHNLSKEYGIDINRLTAVGVSSACPVSSNRSEEGRSKNRRVELVEN